MTTLISRRHLLGIMGATTAWFTCGTMAFASAPTENRFIFINMRGGVDGLCAVPPLSDPQYAAIRGNMALIGGKNDPACLPLDGFFFLHPKLPNLKKMYQDKEALIVHAVASPYRDHSHFDGQDVLESGLTAPGASHNGWLGRTLALLTATKGLAVGKDIPLVLMGDGQVTSWTPTTTPNPNREMMQLLGDLYQDDPVLAAAIAGAIESKSLSDRAMRDPASAAMQNSVPGMLTPIEDDFVRMAKAAGGMMSGADGPRVGVLHGDGYDTHSKQGKFIGYLPTVFEQFDNGLDALKTALGVSWKNTVILCATEFGRTARENGTEGTDHGVGTTAFLLGGAVAGGKVIADWPGLAPQQLLEDRDLRPTTDLRALIKGILTAHLGIDAAALNDKIFPNSATIAAKTGLLRT